jgi:hypothetical protein
MPPTLGTRHSQLTGIQTFEWQTYTLPAQPSPNIQTEEITMARSDIRQQNAERRLSHARWATEARSGMKTAMIGVGMALVFVLFFVVRH